MKLDEIITHLDGPRDDVAGIEVKSHKEIEELQEELGTAKSPPVIPPLTPKGQASGT